MEFFFLESTLCFSGKRAISASFWNPGHRTTELQFNQHGYCSDQYVFLVFTREPRSVAESTSGFFVLVVVESLPAFAALFV